MNFTLSLKTKITIVFAFLFLLLLFTSIPLHRMQETEAHRSVLQNYERLIQYVRQERMSRDSVVKYLENLNFVEPDKPRELLRSFKEPTIRRDGFEIFVIEERYYLHIITPHFRILLQDKSNKFEPSYIDIFIVFFVVFLFAFIYYLIIKNINDTEHQLKSRKLFLRTVMHELKTPIAKGRIVSELIDDEKQKNRIITIFEKLNLLIDDFAKTEQIVSKNYTPNIYGCIMKSVVEKSINMLMLEDKNNISLENISTKKIDVDFDLFALALKNLIDNGIKYSLDGHVSIKEEENAILVISNGSELPKPLDDYFKAFHNDIKEKNHGMGLGLYIVNSILQMHQMSLKYQHFNGENIFKITLENRSKE